MKNSLIALVIVSALITLPSCKGNKKQDEQTTQTTQETGDTKQTQTSAAEPKTFAVTATPDSVSLGKNKEVLMKVKNLKAVELSTPDGKTTGIELSYDLEATNRQKLGASSIGIYPNDFRLELDNGTKISPELANSFNVNAESTASSTGNTFKLPAGTKATALNLFYDETRASLKLEMK